MRLLAWTLAALVAVGAPAWAQLDMVTPVFQAQTLKNVLDSNDRAFGHGAAAPGMHKAPSPVPTTYRASPAVSARVRKQFSDWMATQAGAEGGRQTALAMRRTDPVQNWARLVASDGLRPGDTADALAAYWVLNWMMANGADNDRARTLAVRQQVRGILAGNPALTRLDDAGRQEFAEVLMLNFLIQQAAYADAVKRGDQAMQRKLGDAAVARFRAEMGVDLRQLSLTAQGLVKR